MIETLDALVADGSFTFSRQADNPVEHALARMLKAEPDDIRRMIWRNFDELIRETECARLLPRRIRSYLIAAGSK